ncbi:MAG: hypothetical protein WC796_03375 [Candidatus Pacearchaeota archaeon]|jgi:hypothetical protein
MKRDLDIQVFDYVPKLDAFVVRPEFERFVRRFGLYEWNPVVFIGRYFARDNDFGEHWFDNHDLREEIAERAYRLGYEPEKLYIIDPKRFRDERDGPCHSDELRKQFWTDVLKSLRLSRKFLRNEAKEQK